MEGLSLGRGEYPKRKLEDQDPQLRKREKV